MLCLPVHLVLEAKVELLVAPVHKILAFWFPYFPKLFSLKKLVCVGTINWMTKTKVCKRKHLILNLHSQTGPSSFWVLLQLKFGNNHKQGLSKTIYTKFIRVHRMYVFLFFFPFPNLSYFFFFFPRLACLSVFVQLQTSIHFRGVSKNNITSTSITSITIRANKSKV